ncbi:hydroxyisourate hydrolase [Streptomyces sp. HNM0663]|uniref:Hydroxyisourate hydrolase n=1 Tax=Streptomyces chengmaiensis TaxID=3040919 RepID=A0ABT6HRW0_9ACTN|nr:hydroxyisourate hydrolase [Streptomyces chengmaiensis]MDH2390604.1 hydroxyisourate hydrolase [Streptomyces chengmaiensis]
MNIHRSPDGTGDDFPKIVVKVTDLEAGGPASGLAYRLARLETDGWRLVASGETDRYGALVYAEVVQQSHYQLRLEVGSYFSPLTRPRFYDPVTLAFHSGAASYVHHISVLLSPEGFQTYVEFDPPVR